MMNHLYEQLTALKLTGFRDALKKQLAQPGTYQELGFEERLSLLTAEELTCRENRKAERLIKHARFRLNAELSKLDYRNNRGLDRALIRSLSQGNWLTLKQNILLTGATGSGKTFLACALGHNACRQGYKVYYYRLKALMEQCYQGHADGRYSKLLTRLNNSDLKRPGFPGECFICELRLPDHRFRWKHNKLFLLLPEEYGPAFPAIVDCYTSPPT